MADTHFIYGVENGNVLDARRLYGDSFLSRCLPNRKTFERLHRRLRETGSFASGMPDLEEHVLREFEEQPETSTWTVSAAANVGHMTV
ncbi:hypothetical protein TNIN_414961 [Trichonephila inaurata madagascariensis]|uniref:DUF4817 domain-containing protein n=1 Tax=Trichonephila inaurata madagascariensis TaxID=2747483 RepID=A0A8X6YJY5_9ARAC|nr:hypothetical protein TNIN_414961 [Trichonephila inaurata madagascariensis]